MSAHEDLDSNNGRLSPAKPSQATTIAGTSYVYPVRSLLSGIQKSSEKPAGPVSEASETRIGGETREADLNNDHQLSPSPSTSNPSDIHDSLTPVPRVTVSTPSESTIADDQRLASSTIARPAKRKQFNPNYRTFSLEEDPSSQRIFHTFFDPSLHRPTQMFSRNTSRESVLTRTDEESQEFEFDLRHPPQLSDVASDAFSSIVAGQMFPCMEDLESSGPSQALSNFSQSGIVHLLPIESSTSTPLRMRTSSGSASGTSRHSSSTSPMPSSGSARGDADLRSSQMPSGCPSSPQLLSGASATSDPSESDNSVGGVTTSSGSDGPRVTFRYQHVEDEDGHHLILGREGTMTKCEDEPIRTPGAVQGYGILIAVEEDEQTGNLVVRQVSENSTELLGLSPQYLFSLECLSEILPDNQADILFDNIQYLSDSSLTAEEQAENLHVFVLSGWGQPGTTAIETPGNEPGRRSWTCWCAAHRPQMDGPPISDSQGFDSSCSNMIILEFELEKDAFNPLYPPTLDGSVSSGISSPSSGSAGLSDSSGRTLVSNGSEGEYLTTPDDSNSSRVNSSVSATSTNAQSPTPSTQLSSAGDISPNEWLPSPEAILESTTSFSKPIPALERLRRSRRYIGESPSPPSFGFERGSARAARGSARRRRGTNTVGMMDVFAVMAQINEQLGATTDMDHFMKVVAGVIKDITQFHRVLVYEFDEQWNGMVVAELMDWSRSHDLFKGLHFPASDIPAQARELYVLNKVRLLYDRDLPTARIVVRSRRDLRTPLDMTHCYLRAMSPIHIKYLANMGVRASMSVSIVAFGKLWGLVACHSYGSHGMRVSFPVRQMLRLLSQSISRNVERLTYAHRLHTRKLINTMPSDQHPSGYIVSNADDLLGLFDADYGVLVIGEGAKILGPNQHGQEVLIIAEYLRLKQFNTIQVSQAVTEDYPDLQLTMGLEIIAGLLYVPLSAGGRDYIAFLRKGQPRVVKWAGRPYKDGEQRNLLEPRSSFRTWSETVAGRCRAWSDEHLETAGVLALVYGKFIEVWRQKENALQTTKLTNILLSNAGHEVRTPLNHIINYLELAMNGSLDTETRENLSQSHAASKSLLFTINDLLDLTRLESGNETSFNEPFNLHQAIEDATLLYRTEAVRRGINFTVDVASCPKMVVGDSRKIRTVVANITANALKFTSEGSIEISCHAYEEPQGLRSDDIIAIEIVIADTGCGIPADRLESIFREFEQVETTPAKPNTQGLGLGLAVVARIVEQLGGQLRVDSELGQGSRFSFLLPFGTNAHSSHSSVSSTSSSRSSALQSRQSNHDSRGSEIDHLVEAFSSNHMNDPNDVRPASPIIVDHDFRQDFNDTSERTANSEFTLDLELGKTDSPLKTSLTRAVQQAPSSGEGALTGSVVTKLRILIVEDNDINRIILKKRLTLDGHIVVDTTNGQEGLDMVESDWNFDCILMDIQMPLLNGYEATERIREIEQLRKEPTGRISHELNGRIPIFAVSASLSELHRENMYKLGLDGWILKPIDFKRLRNILTGVTDATQREKDVYKSGCSWELGGWLKRLHKAHTHEHR